MFTIPNNYYLKISKSQQSINQSAIYFLIYCFHNKLHKIKHLLQLSECKYLNNRFQQFLAPYCKLTKIF